LGESELTAPLPDVCHQRRTVDLSSLERHPPIVETAPKPGGDEVTLRWATEDDTRAFAQRLAACPALADARVELHGDLGVGKTTLVRHLLRALGVQGRIKSPTYAVVEPHEIPGFPIWHFDFYRFSDPREWEDAGFRDLYDTPGLKLAEWPERAAGLLPAPDLAVHLAIDDDGARQVRLRAHTPRGRELLA
jgi:tRNA threonylcarbamoyladenosine biosynthesis protein TsaE